MAAADRVYWWRTLSSPESDDAADPRDMGRIDVAVVGAGYTGLSAARTLAKSGAAVAVFEQEAIGWGASSRNAGQVLTGLRVEPAALVRRYGDARARTLFAASLDALRELETLIIEEDIACEYVRTGHAQAASKPGHFEAFRREQELLARVFHHPVSLVEAAAQQTEIGSTRYHGLLVDERSGSLNPARYVVGLADVARRAGARIFTRTPVRRLQRASDGWTISIAQGEIMAKDVLVATNGYVNDVTPALQRRFMPVGSYSIVTEPLDAATANRLLPRRRMAFDSKHFLSYFRLTADGRLLFGGRAAFGVPTPERTRRAAQLLQGTMARVFPELARVKIDDAWSGNVAFTRDQLPHAGRLNGLWFAGGYGGHGIAMATALGRVVGERIAGRPVAHPLLELPCPTIPLQYGRPWYLPAIGGYYRILDWLR